MTNKTYIPTKHSADGKTAWIDVEELELRIIDRRSKELEDLIHTQSLANETLLKEIRRLKILNERYVAAGKQEYLNVILAADGVFIKQIDKIAAVAVGQTVPASLENGCYYLNRNGYITLDERKLEALNEVI